MGLIINSGQARSLAYAALKQASRGFRRGENDDGTVAHGAERSALVQTQLIESDEGEGKMKVSLVLVHAQDHLMTSCWRVSWLPN
jgi:PTS system cellobiose-specific IIA component